MSGLAVSARFFAFQPPNRPTAASLLIPMDDAQSDHLKAYGVAYRAIQAGLKAEWLLNYRGGSFLIPDADALRRDAALNGVRTEPVDDGSGRRVDRTVRAPVWFEPRAAGKTAMCAALTLAWNLR